MNTATAPAPGGPKLVGAALAAFIAAAALLIQPWEGRRLTSYQDIVGIWTVCDGITGKAATPGAHYSNKQCDAMLATDIGKHYDGVSRCIRMPLEQNQMVAVTSWTYNVGVKAACGSTLIRKVNAGAPASEWCRELFKWNRAGGKVVRGLDNRRRAEFKVCMGYEP